MKSKGRIRFLVNNIFFDDQDQAELYALEITNPMSSKVWVNMIMYYNDDDYYCIKSYIV